MSARASPTSRSVAVAGNPNSGKTSLFNALTGARRRVGNYPGVTVERLEGQYRHNDQTYHLTDLPGTYSLSAMSAEERVARKFLAEDQPDVVVDVVDSTNLERNLYLATQLIEMGVNLVLALNMADEARDSGFKLDLKLLSDLLGGIPVVETVGHLGRGADELKEAIARSAAEPVLPPSIPLGRDLERAIDSAVEALSEVDTGPYTKRWLAIKLLEGDGEVERLILGKGEAGKKVIDLARQEAASLRKLSGEDPVVLMADRRYGFVAGLLREAVLGQPPVDRVTLSEKIDQVVTHRLLGLPLFLLTLYAIFWLTFRVGEPLANLLEVGFHTLGSAVSGLWPAGSRSVVRSLLVDGLIGGVGGVMVFLPNVVLLFLGLSFLEDTGYMARAAFLMDRVMHRIGLHGKSFIPMMVGFGCNVPAVMACRILENERDRLVTMLVLPLISCGARLPGYLLIISAFFPSGSKAVVLMGVYLFGVLMAALMARVLRSTVLSGEDAPFVMELPPYRMPTAKAVGLHAWERAWMYLRKAGTIILVISLLLWGLSSFPVKERFDVDRRVAAGEKLSKKKIEVERAREKLEYSLAGRVGRAMEPVLNPMGFDWRIGTAFLGAFAAKEVFVAQMGIVFSAGAGEKNRSGLSALIKESYSVLAGIGMLIFLLMATPCVATFAVVRKESGSWKWPVLQWTGLTLLGYLVAAAVYQVGGLLGF